MQALRWIGWCVCSLAVVALAGCYPLSQPPSRPVPNAAPVLSQGSALGSLPVYQPVAQAGSQGQPPGEARDVLPVPTFAPTSVPAALASTCPDLPAGWIPYRVRRCDTLYRIALASGTTVGTLVHANCLPDPRLIHTGQQLYLPPEGTSSALPAAVGGGGDGASAAQAPSAALPVVIVHFAASRNVAGPGQVVQLSWAIQGSAATVQLGWLNAGQVVVEYANLPPSGILGVTIPADGRRQIPFVLQAGSGEVLASAFATVQVTCDATWFFAGAAGSICPYPAVSVQAIVQPFESGQVVWLPALSRLYALFGDGSWESYPDLYRAGMPYRDAALTPPVDRLQPEGAIGYRWRGDESLAARLGWATQPPASYTATFQRAADPERETVYLSAPGGGVTMLMAGQAWDLIAAAAPAR